MKITTLKNIAILSLLISFSGLSIANAESAAAQKEQKQSIAIIDLEEVLKNSTAMKDAQNKLGKKQAAFQKEIDKQQEALEAESKKILAKKSVLSEEAFKKEQEKFAKKLGDLKKMVEEKQESLKKVSLTAVNKVNDKIKDILAEIRTENGYNIIISSANTVYYDENFDISNEVIKRLNKKISKVDI